MVFFENHRCVKCDHPLGFLPDTLQMAALEQADGQNWRALGRDANQANRTYRSCANGLQHQVCNWLVPANDDSALCIACRLNEIIPDLSDPNNIKRWFKLELAKRRCVYTWLKLGLPVGNHTAPPLRFRFLQDRPNEPVKTGHDNGVITINLAEADDDEREHRRLNLHEPYRTLVGHLRHESGHYYWDRLIANSPRLPDFRKVFGDESADYGVALQKHYQNGPPANWAEHYVTAYASSHPWEDWAETWAHYLHILDTLESAASFGMGMKNPAAPIAAYFPIKYDEKTGFDQLLAGWAPLTCALNAINRSMGLADLYPFVISAPVVEKLGFIHKVILGLREPTPARH